MINKDPIYNLKVVMNETKIKADVLRAWERRYEIPMPQRTPGGHRLYSAYDIETVKWLRARQAIGYSISHAVLLWKEIIHSGRDPFLIHPAVSIPHELSDNFENNRLDTLRNEWLNACLSFDAGKAEDVVSQAFGMYPVETVCHEILQRGISEIGRLWYENKATVQQEHFASALAAQRIEGLIAVTPQPTSQQTILVGCPAGEWHLLPILLLTLLLRRKGWNVINLGANIPLEQMEQTAVAIQPVLMVMAAQQLGTAAAIKSAAILFSKLSIPFAFGGLIFNRIPELLKHIPAFYLGEQLEHAVDVINQLITASPSLPTMIGDDNPYQEAAEIYSQNLPLIEAGLINTFQIGDFPKEFLTEINSHFAGGLLAALKLGNPAFFEPDLEWVKKLMSERKIPAGMLEIYMDAYLQAISLEMPETGIFITAWFRNWLANNSEQKIRSDHVEI